MYVSETKNVHIHIPYMHTCMHTHIYVYILYTHAHMHIIYTYMYTIVSYAYIHTQYPRDICLVDNAKMHFMVFYVCNTCMVITQSFIIYKVKRGKIILL